MFGGRLVALMDTVAAKVARRHRRGNWVTARIDHLEFLQPIYEDETLLFYSSINRVWNTSCEIGVKVVVRRDNKDIWAVSGYFTFVALDTKGKPTPIPQIIPEGQEELRRFHEAEERRAKRLEERKKLLP